MLYLLCTSVIWALSFGLIKIGLVGVDASFSAFVRLAIALVCFLPFMRRAPLRTALSLCAIGAVQFGLMYVFYLRSFEYLRSHQVAVLTVFTPLWVTLLNDAIHRSLQVKFLLAVLISVVGTLVISLQEFGTVAWNGFAAGVVLVQLSNACFAVGQIAYKELMSTERTQLSTASATLYMFIGGAAATMGICAVLGAPAHSFAMLTSAQVATLIYLGAIGSGLSFFLWNTGLRKVNVGTLAIMNNLKIPLAVAASLLIFGEQTNIIRLLIGGAIIAGALWLNEVLNKKRV